MQIKTAMIAALTASALLVSTPAHIAADVNAPQPVPYTYADATKFVTADATGGGNGSANAAWTLSEAMAQATAGDIVGVGPGIYVGTNTAQRMNPAWNPANSGTAQKPIVFVAQNPAALTAGYGKVLDPAVHSDLRNGATAADIVYRDDDGGASPTFGVRGGDYIYWIGFRSDNRHDNNKPQQDIGPFLALNSTGSRLYQSTLIGWQDPQRGSNYNGIRLEEVDAFVAADNYVDNFHTTSNSHNAAGILTYETYNSFIEHNRVVNSDGGIFLKGDKPANLGNYSNTIRFNYVDTGSAGDLIFMKAGTYEGAYRPNYAYQNMLMGQNAIEFATGVENITAENIQIYNNLMYDNTKAFFFARAQNLVSGKPNMIRSNIVVSANRVYENDRAIDDIAQFATFFNTDYNLYHANSDFFGGWGTFGETTYATWQQTHGRDTNSLTANPRFTDPAAEDFRLTPASPALGAGVDDLNLLGNGEGAPINIGPYISADQSEVFGIRNANP